jgi:molybdopterin-guanine dinucleotide biosynthesis protein A
MSRLLGVILCGGTGRRFGGAKKGQLIFEGETFLARAEAALSPLVTRVIWEDQPTVGGAIGAICHALTEHYEDEMVCHALTDRIGGGVLVIPCDMPYLSTELLSLLIADFGEYNQAVCFFDQPLVGIYPTSALPVIEAQIAAGQYRMHGLLEKLPHRIVTPPKEAFPNWRVNINTKDEYMQLIRDAGLPR